MKAALVYTSTTPELIELVEREVRKNIGEEAELIDRSSYDTGICGTDKRAHHTDCRSGCAEPPCGAGCDGHYGRRFPSQLHAAHVEDG